MKVKTCKSFWFKSKTGDGCAAKIVVEQSSKGYVLIEKYLVAKTNPLNFVVVRKFKGYLVLKERITLFDQTLFTIMKTLYEHQK